jgi:hypothetical protein
VGSGGSLPRVEWQEREAGHSPPSSSEAKNSGSILPLPHLPILRLVYLTLCKPTQFFLTWPVLYNAFRNSPLQKLLIVGEMVTGTVITTGGMIRACKELCHDLFFSLE